MLFQIERRFHPLPLHVVSTPMPLRNCQRQTATLRRCPSAMRFSSPVLAGSTPVRQCQKLRCANPVAQHAETPPMAMNPASICKTPIPETIPPRSPRQGPAQRRPNPRPRCRFNVLRLNCNRYHQPHKHSLSKNLKDRAGKIFFTTQLRKSHV